MEDALVEENVRELAEPRGVAITDGGRVSESLNDGNGLDDATLHVGESAVTARGVASKRSSRGAGDCVEANHVLACFGFPGAAFTTHDEGLVSTRLGGGVILGERRQR
jgi:hypothetical protein